MSEISVFLHGVWQDVSLDNADMRSFLSHALLDRCNQPIIQNNCEIPNNLDSEALHYDVYNLLCPPRFALQDFTYKHSNCRKTWKEECPCAHHKHQECNSAESIVSFCED